MMKKETFVVIMTEMDTYFNGDIADAFHKLGASENVINNCMDNILSALTKEIDPLKIAATDPFTEDCGDYICEWLFGGGEFQEKCPTAESLYDYIYEQYALLNEKK